MEQTFARNLFHARLTFNTTFLFQTLFGAGLLPPSVQNISISNARRIAFRDDTFSNITRLHSIHLNKIVTLRIGKINWTQVVDAEHMTITISNSNVLDLDSGAFSGLRSPGPGIHISDVFSCHISESAFHSDSSIQAVVLQNIQILRLDNGGFRAAIGQLKLDSTIFTGYCGNYFFSEHIGNLSLTRVTISEVRNGCLGNGFEKYWDSLTIRYSNLGNIEPYGISGHIRHVVIEKSSLGSVPRRGLNLITSTFTVKDTRIGELKEDAFFVLFYQSASLQESNITSLRANALRWLTTWTRRDEGEATLTIRGVLVDEAEYRSLTISGNVRLVLRDVVLRDRCQCDVGREKVRLYLEGEVLHDATEKQRQTAEQTVHQIRCTVGTTTTTPTLAEFFCRNCPVKDEERSLCSRLVSRTAVGVWVWPVCGVALLLLLLLTAAVVITLTRRKRRQSKELQTPGDSRNSGALKQTAPVEIPATLRPAEWQNAPADAVTSTPDGDDALDPEPLYTEVGPAPPDKPPPGTRTTQYVEMLPLPVPQYDNCDAAGQPHQHAVYENADADAAPTDQRLLYTNV